MITRILHTTFLTTDLTQSRAFYENVLGLRPDPNRPVMSYDGVWYEIAPNQQIHLMLL
jgi:glyoxylase I family protein